MRFNDTVFKLPPKQSKANEGSKISEHEKLKSSIASVRVAIESTERKYKDYVNMRKRQEMNEGGKNLLQDSLIIDDLISRAQEELYLLKTKQQTQTTDKNKSDIASDENLQISIEDTKAWYKKRKEMLTDGPKFQRHSYSPFGDILLVSGLTGSYYIVITSNNTVELWEIKTTGPIEDQACTIIEVFEVPTDSFTTATELFHQDCDNESDYLKIIPDEENLLPGIRGLPFQKRKPSPVVETKAPSKPYLSDDIKEEGEDGEECVEDTGPTQRLPRTERTLITKEQLDSLACNKMPGSPQIDWDTYALSDAPKVYFRSAYFCGTSSGNGLLIEVLWAYDPTTKVISCACQVRIEKELSQNAITLGYFYCLNDGTPLVVTEVSTKTGEHFVIGVTLDMEIEWSCRCDIIKLSMSDRCTRYVSKEQQLDLNRDKKEIRAPEEKLITTYELDSIHNCLLLGTQAGVILRLFYQRDLKKRELIDKQPIGDEIKTFGAPLKLMWCLQTFPQQETSIVEEVEVFNKILAEDKTAEVASEIKSIKEMLHPITHISHLLIGGTDGIIRLYLNDNLKVNPRPSIFFIDRYFRNDAKKKLKSTDAVFDKARIACSCDSISTPEGAHVIVGVTSNMVYDPEEADDVFIEVQLLSHTIASGKSSETSTASTNSQYSIRILDSKSGLCVVYHGKYWSIVSVKDTIDYVSRASIIKKEAAGAEIQSQQARDELASA